MTRVDDPVSARRFRSKLHSFTRLVPFGTQLDKKIDPGNWFCLNETTHKKRGCRWIIKHETRLIISLLNTKSNVEAETETEEMKANSRHCANSVSDLCKYLENNDYNRFLKLFFAGRFTRRSFPTSCPIKPGKYFMEGFKFNETALKVRAVETKFMVRVDLCSMARDKLKCAVNMKFYGEIRDRKRWEKEVAERSVNKTI